jgi:hypothetical protein
MLQSNLINGACRKRHVTAGLPHFIIFNYPLIPLLPPQPKTFEQKVAGVNEC